MKISKFVQDAMNKFLALSIVKNAFDITKIRELLDQDKNLRNNRFDNLCNLAVQCYNFKNFWNLATTKQARKDAKCDVKAEDAIAFVFGYGKQYFYRLATMGELIVTKPTSVARFKKQNQEQSGEYVMDALTFIAFVKEGKLNVKKTPQPQPQQGDEGNENNVTDTQSQSNVTDSSKQIVFHLLCDGKEFIVTKHSKGGYTAELKGISKQELKPFITKYATKDMQDLLKTYSKELAFGVTRNTKGILQFPTELTETQKNLTLNSVSCFKW